MPTRTRQVPGGSAVTQIVFTKAEIQAAMEAFAVRETGALPSGTKTFRMKTDGATLRIVED